MRPLLLAVAGVLAWFGLRWLVRQPPDRRWQVLATALATALLVLAASGRHWLFAPAAVALLALSRLRRGTAAGGGAASGGQRSVVETRFLRMTLDHDSGAMDGTVLAGVFAGQALGTLSPAQLGELMAECRREDPDSAALLAAYLQRTHGEHWQQHAEEGPHAEGVATDGDMTRGEALEILGLDESADDEQIREAHRRLMQKLHPDRGGSTYLASKINQAKTRLLGG